MNTITINKVSVVCPFYNEAAIIRKAVERLLSALHTMSEQRHVDWELILVNDGSLDNGADRIKPLLMQESKCSLFEYTPNHGRGYALKTGINQASGDIIVTTEIDLSWGEDVIDRIVGKFTAEPGLDFVIASPHLAGGGFVNVPSRRVWISRIGNTLLRLLFTKKITMNTGMTRGYRRGVIQPLPVDEWGKEFHVEVIFKLLMLKYRFAEIPVVLEWKTDLAKSPEQSERISSFKTLTYIFSHLHFAAFVNPIRYFWAFSVLCFLIGSAFSVFACYRLLLGLVAVYSGLMGVLFFLVSFLFFGFGILSSQNNRILTELWKIRHTQAPTGKFGA